MAQSKDQQVKAVVIGMALGVLAQGVDAVTSKMSLEFAFNHAWRRWPKAGRFSSINGHNPGNLFWIGLSKSEGRKLACAAWDLDRWCSPYIVYDEWTVEEALELHADDTDVTAQDWIELGRLFVGRLKPEELWRSGATMEQ